MRGEVLDCTTDFGRLAQLELSLKEQLNLKSDISYDVVENNNEFIVSLSIDQFNSYMPSYVCHAKSLLEGKQTIIQKSAIFVELGNELKNTQNDMGERMGVHFKEIYQVILDQLGFSFQDRNEDACLLSKNNISTNDAPFTNWFGKQKARFRIKKNENLKIKKYLNGSMSKNVTPINSMEKVTSETKAQMQQCNLLDRLQNESADVKIFRISETLELQPPSFAYEEKQTGDGGNEIKCTLSFMGHSFSISRVGCKKIQVKELVAEQALEVLHDKIAALEYQKAQLDELHDAKREKKSQKSCGKEYTPASIGTLVSIDVEKLNTPYWEVMNDTKDNDNVIPGNIVLLLQKFATNRRLQSPVYNIRQVGFHFTGNATFAGYEFDLQNRTFSSKKETRAQLAFLIWKSLKKVCGEEDLESLAKKPCTKPTLPQTTGQNEPCQAKYVLKPSVELNNTKKDVYSHGISKQNKRFPMRFQHNQFRTNNCNPFITNSPNFTIPNQLNQHNLPPPLQHRPNHFIPPPRMHPPLPNAIMPPTGQFPGGRPPQIINNCPPSFPQNPIQLSPLMHKNIPSPGFSFNPNQQMPHPARMHPFPIHGAPKAMNRHHPAAMPCVPQFPNVPFRGAIKQPAPFGHRPIPPLFCNPSFAPINFYPNRNRRI